MSLNSVIIVHTQEELPVLPKHSYPRFLVIIGIILGVFLVTELGYFFCFRFPELYKTKKIIIAAEKYFEEKDYHNAIMTITPVVEKYNNYSKGKILLAKSFFALSEMDDEAYFRGCCCLCGVTVSKKEYAELRKYVPQKFHEKFDSPDNWSKA